MIQRAFISEWGEFTPWSNRLFIEQDLIICRALIEIFNDPFLSEHLAFRGGTAIHKLFLQPQPRYSEDIDLVQKNPEPIKKTLDHLRDALSFLGDPIVKQKKHNNTMVYKIPVTESINVGELKLKIEINCKEHFSVYPFITKRLSIKNGWYSGEGDIITYELEELLGTKLRALYQRRKGRDLFDLYQAITSLNLDPEKIITSYKKYFSFVSSHLPTYKEFVRNMDEKLTQEEFLHDTDAILRPGINYSPQQAYNLIHDRLLIPLFPST